MARARADASIRLAIGVLSGRARADNILLSGPAATIIIMREFAIYSKRDTQVSVDGSCQPAGSVCVARARARPRPRVHIIKLHDQQTKSTNTSLGGRNELRLVRLQVSVSESESGRLFKSKFQKGAGRLKRTRTWTLERESLSTALGQVARRETCLGRPVCLCFPLCPLPWTPRRRVNLDVT